MFADERLAAFENGAELLMRDALALIDSDVR